MMGDSRISHKVLTHLVCYPPPPPSYMYVPETMALTEKQQEELQTKTNEEGESWELKGAVKRRLDELGVEVREKKSIKKKLVRSRLKCAGHVDRMADERLVKRADVQKMKGEMMRGRSILHATGGLERLGEEWRTPAKYRRNRGLLINNVEKSLGREEEEKDDGNRKQGQPHP